MKTRNIVVLCAALVASGHSVRADDTADQAAARAALEQKMGELDHSPAQPLPDANSAATMATLAESSASATDAASVATVAAAEMILAAAPATEVPATAAPAKDAPATTAPAAGDFDQPIPATDASVQAAALAALQQKMQELDQSAAQPPPDTNSVVAVTKPAESTTNAADTVTTNAVTVQTAPVAAPANEPSAGADAAAQAAALIAVQQKMHELNQPEAQPVTETPAAQAPGAISPGIAPAAASVAVAPAAAAGPVEVPTTTQPAAAPAALKPDPRLPAPILPYTSPGQARPVNQLVTVSGAIYKNVEVESVKDDGIIISYTAADGGWGRTKVYFEDLPADIRQQYNK
jgi:hypothetical protein